MQIFNIWRKGKLELETSKFSSLPREWVHVSLYLVLCLWVKSFGVTIQKKSSVRQIFSQETACHQIQFIKRLEICNFP